MLHNIDGHRKISHIPRVGSVQFHIPRVGSVKFHIPCVGSVSNEGLSLSRHD